MKAAESTRLCAARWCTAVAAVSETIYATMDNNNNLTMLRYNSDASDDHARQMMESVVEFHLGDMVNRKMPRFHHGYNYGDDKPLHFTSRESL
jgi:hypothetical protein